MIATWLASDNPPIPGFEGWKPGSIAQQAKDAVVSLAWQRSFFPSGINPALNPNIPLPLPYTPPDTIPVAYNGARGLIANNGKSAQKRTMKPAN